MIPISPDLDVATGKADAAVELGGKPGFLAADGKGKAYINLVDKDQVAVVDTKAMEVVAKWSHSSRRLRDVDTERRRFIGCRKPQKLIVMNAEDGKVLADLPIGAGVDATKFDRDVFASCVDGTLTVARETAADKFEVVQTVQTPRGAKTMGIDSTTHTLYLPTAEFEPVTQGQSRSRPKSGSFMIVVVSRSGR
jgi:hypothetical protein